MKRKKINWKRVLFYVIDESHNAVSYVGQANYAEREQEAHRMIDDALETAKRK